MKSILHTLAFIFYLAAPVVVTLAAYKTWMHGEVPSVIPFLAVAVFLDARALLLPWIARAMSD